MHIKIEDAQRGDLTDHASLIRDEQLAWSNFEQANHSIGLLIDSEVQTLLLAEKSDCTRDSLGELLRLRAGSAHIVDDHGELIAFAKRSLSRRRTRALSKVHGRALRSTSISKRIAPAAVEDAVAFSVRSEQPANVEFEFHLCSGTLLPIF